MITPEIVERFQKIYFQDTGEEISLEKAKEELIATLNLYAGLYRLKFGPQWQDML